MNIMKKVTSFSVVFYVMAFFCLANEPMTPITIEKYGSANTINAMAIHGDYLWCATEGGIVRWNTKDFTYTVFTVADGLADNSVKDIAVGDDGVVWAGTMGGAWRYDGNSWKTFTKADGLLSNEIGPIAVDHQGTVWLAVYNYYGLSRYENGVWTSYPRMNIKKIAVGLDNSIWFAHWGEGIERYNAGEWTKYTDSQLLYIYNLTVGPDGVVWVVTGNEINWFADGKWTVTGHPAMNSVFYYPQAGGENGVCWGWIPGTGPARFDSKTITVQRYLFPENVEETNLTAVATDGDEIWFGLSDGLYWFDGNNWKVLLADGMPSNSLTAISTGSDDTVWVGTKRRGIARFDGMDWALYLRGDDLHGIIKVIDTSASGIVWASTRSDRDIIIDDGISRFDGIKWESFEIAKVFTDSNYKFMAVSPDGLAWFIDTDTPASIASFDGKIVAMYTLPGNDRITSIAFDSDGTGWMSSWNTLYRFDGNSFTAIPKPSFWQDMAFGGLMVGNNTVYFKAENYYYSYRDGEWAGCGGSFKCYSVSPRGELWGGKEEGLFLCTGDDWKYYLTNSMVLIIAADSDATSEKVWISSGGLKCLTFSPLEQGRISGKVTLASSGKVVSGAKIVITPGNYITYTDESGAYSVKYIPAGAYSVSATIYLKENPYYYEVNMKGFVVTANVTTVADLVFPSNITGVSEEPATFRVGLPYPNPFNPSTSIVYTLPAKERAMLAVYDITGRKVRELLSGILPAGAHTAVWDGRDADGRAVSSGVYTARITTGRGEVNRKMTLVR